ncbi:hypothetical protein SEVIR_7G139000v4 [Setaria viridis]|uniref:HMA domain-containing protein n=1 Tax=Setaria viridis TaxID=4556 RepID=A0A4U6TPU6_SETVI|nr:heavy metal-associated isoprenylated plant protein 47-like [Setaria viridis]TKW04878.1 hypothetical protein SEVIR_7G139000v2 [Setaria viridis]
MKKKIVIKVCMPCERCRTKALKVVARADGLISVAITGDEKLEVVGDGVDPVCLVRCLRKKICYAEILQVEEVKDKKEEEKKPEKPKKAEQQAVVVHALPQSCPGYCSCHPPSLMVCEDDRNSCAIM